MVTCIAGLWAIAGPHTAWAQWACASGICSTTDAVGIGTSSPTFQLQTRGVIAADQGNNVMVLLGGSAADSAAGTSYGGIWYDTTSNSLQINALSGGVAWRNIVLNGNGAGNVGIGTTAPASQLTISGAGQATGNFNTAGPLAGALELDDSGDVGGNGGTIVFSAATQAWKFAAIKGFVENGGNNSQGAIVFAVRPVATNPTLTEAMRVDYSGNVGIGTTNPVHQLQVAGTIGAEEVIVSSTGADYVFQPDYPLRPISELAAFINQNHHLPDIPSAAEVQEKGLNLGEMQTKPLAKIEELTLHMIEADEHSRHLEQQNRELQDRIARLEAPGEGSGNRQR